MDFSKRQIQILALLINEHDWMTSDKIAANIGSNKKTIQADIKNLCAELGDKLILERNKRSGYFLKYLSEEVQEDIFKEAKKHKIYSSMNFRASALVVYLLFQNDYVSMQHLADTFFISKTAISIEINTIRRWMERNTKIDIQVSVTNGLKMIATENMKRIFIASLGTEKVLSHAHLDHDIPESFSVLLAEIQSILMHVLLKHNYVISGEEFTRLTRYLAISIIRSRAGWLMDDFVNVTAIPLVDYLCEKLNQKVDYEYSELERAAITQRILEINNLYTDNKYTKELEEKLHRFERKVIQVTNISEQVLFKDPQPLLAHIKQMENRIQSGHNVLNHYAKPTVRAYPLETYLIQRYFSLYFQLSPNLAEISYLVMYLAIVLEPFKYSCEGIIVSDQSFSMANHLKYRLLNLSGKRIKNFEIVPTYLFGNYINRLNEYDLLITTEPEIIFEDNRFLYVNSILSNEEDLALTEELNDKLDLIEEQKTDKMLARIFPKENDHLINENIKSLYKLIPNSDDLVVLPIGEKGLFACLIRENLKTKIKKYTLSQAIIFNQIIVKKIIYVECNALDNIIMVFKAVAKILERKI